MKKELIKIAKRLIEVSKDLLKLSFFEKEISVKGVTQFWPWIDREEKEVDYKNPKIVELVIDKIELEAVEFETKIIKDRWTENIPVGYILIGYGKCPLCGEELSFYIVEEGEDQEVSIYEPNECEDGLYDEFLIVDNIKELAEKLNMEAKRKYVGFGKYMYVYYEKEEEE